METNQRAKNNYPPRKSKVVDHCKTSVDLNINTKSPLLGAVLYVAAFACSNISRVSRLGMVNSYPLQSVRHGRGNVDRSIKDYIMFARGSRVEPRFCQWLVVPEIGHGSAAARAEKRAVG
jgi:hypothetical protein